MFHRPSLSDRTSHKYKLKTREELGHDADLILGLVEKLYPRLKIANRPPLEKFVANLPNASLDHAYFEIFGRHMPSWNGIIPMGDTMRELMLKKLASRTTS